MRTRKRLTKKQLKRDRFVDTTFDWVVWARENGRTVALVAGAALIVGLALILYRTSEARETRQASQKFQEIIQTYAAGNFQLAANDFKQFLSQHGGSAYGDQATLYLANSYMLAGDPKSAVRTFEEQHDRLDGSRLAYEAASLQGAAYEGAGDLEKAAGAYAHAREKARYDFQRAQALMDEARVYAGRKATAKAVEAYRQVIQKYPDTAMAKDARVRSAELTARPLGAPVAATTSSGAAREASTGGDSTVIHVTPAGGRAEGAAEPAASVEPTAEAASQQR